jgi:hypothetical protein
MIMLLVCLVREQNVTPMICVTFVFWQELRALLLSSAVMAFEACRDAPYAWKVTALIAASLISSARADEDEHEEDGTWQKVFEFLAVTFLVGCSALFSGLTLGMTVSRLWYTVAVLYCVTVSTSITIVHRSAAFVLKIISIRLRCSSVFLLRQLRWSMQSVSCGAWTTALLNNKQMLLLYLLMYRRDGA